MKKNVYFIFGLTIITEILFFNSTNAKGVIPFNHFLYTFSVVRVHLAPPNSSGTGYLTNAKVLIPFNHPLYTLLVGSDHLTPSKFI